MASEDRPQAQHLNFLAEVAQDTGPYGLFSVVRGAEARALHLPRVGQSKIPAKNILDLAQSPILSFAHRTLDSIETKHGRSRLNGYWLGLTGPMGPLPTHLSEFAFYEKRYANSQPFGDFLNLISGRMLQLFYRAWADSQPSAIADRPSDDSFANILAALSGGEEGATEHSAFPARARVHYAGLFASRRSAVAIEDGISHLMGQSVKLKEFQPRWRKFEAEDLSRLGQNFCQLGNDAVLGGSILSASDAFRLVIRARNYRDYHMMLPSGSRFAILAEALDAFSPSHIEWDVALEIEDQEAPPAKLDGRAQLGWTSWVKRKSTSTDKASKLIRSDAHLRKIRHHTAGATS